MHDTVVFIIFPSQETLDGLIEQVDGREVQPHKIIVSFLNFIPQGFYSGIAGAVGEGVLRG